MINSGISILPFDGNQVFNNTTLAWDGIKVTVKYKVGENSTANPIEVGDFVFSPSGNIWEVTAVVIATGNTFLTSLKHTKTPSADVAPELGNVSRGAVVTPVNGVVTPHWNAVLIASEIGQIAQLFNADRGFGGDNASVITQGLFAPAQIPTIAVDKITGLTALLADAITTSDLAAVQSTVDNINLVLTTNDVALNDLQELVDFIKVNRTTLDTMGIANIAGLAAALSGKVDIIVGKGLSANDYTTAEKSKLTAIEAGATADQTKLDIDALGVDADTVNGKTVDINVPINALFTDTIYTKPTAEPISYISNLTLELAAKLEAPDIADIITDVQLLQSVLTSGDTTLDTLQEVVDFIKINANTLSSLSINSIAGLTAALSGKVDVVAGKALSTNDYTTVEKSKLGGIEAGATGDQTKAEIDALGVNAATVNSKTVLSNVPAGAVFTDTVYSKPVSETIDYISGLVAALASKQATLISGTNVKTINGTPILGSGDMEILSEVVRVTVDVTSFTTLAFAAPAGVTIIKEYSDSSIKITHGLGKIPSSWSGINKDSVPMTAFSPSSTRNMQVLDANTVIITNVSSFEAFSIALLF